MGRTGPSRSRSRCTRVSCHTKPACTRSIGTRFSPKAATLSKLSVGVPTMALTIGRSPTVGVPRGARTVFSGFCVERISVVWRPWAHHMRVCRRCPAGACLFCERAPGFGRAHLLGHVLCSVQACGFGRLLFELVGMLVQTSGLRRIQHGS